MDTTALLGIAVGAATLTAAAVLTLLRRTRGLSATQRVDFTLGRGASALWRVLPPMGLVVGSVAFAASAVVGLLVAALVVRAISPQVRRPQEAALLVGDTVLALTPLLIGSTLVVCVAAVLGLMAAKHVAVWQRLPT